mmetsp:Transcript_44278/g.72810  ORF Transcript_44278/g.72810 Transcript_44278/m.72810 type:complete len:85 (+) Transcript_44278:82-336(+)
MKLPVPCHGDQEALQLPWELRLPLLWWAFIIIKANIFRHHFGANNLNLAVLIRPCYQCRLTWVTSTSRCPLGLLLPRQSFWGEW